MFNATQTNLLLSQNFWNKVSFLPGLVSSMTVGSTPSSIRFTDTQVKSDTFNILFDGDFSHPHILRDIQQLVNDFTTKKKVLAWWISPEVWNPKIHKLLTTHGLTLNEEEVGMANAPERLHLPTKKVEDLSIVTIETEKELQDYAHVLASVFDPFDEEAIKFYQIVAKAYLQQPQRTHFVAYLSGEPCATCCIAVDESLGGIYDIITHPQFQRRGLGTLMTSHAIWQLQSMQISLIGMQASAQGLPLYRKMGFESFGAFRVYGHQTLAAEYEDLHSRTPNEYR